MELVEAEDGAGGVDGKDGDNNGNERGTVGAIGSDFVGGRGNLLAELLTHDTTISHGPDPRNGEWRTTTAARWRPRY